MTLAQRLTRKPSRFLDSSPRVESGGGSLDSVLRGLFDSRMRLLERQLKDRVDSAIEDFNTSTRDMKSEARKQIENHIKFRSIEIKGADGYTPKKGKDYFDGKTPTERELTPIIQRLIPKTEIKEVKAIPSLTSDQLVEKINTSERLIAFSKIAGLNEWVNKIQQMVREKKGGGGNGGGGSGNRQHEHSAISSATTTVTTTYKIAGAGYDVDVYYNGAYIARGTDYTVGTDQKTITLLFTPSDNSVADVVYTRT